MAEVTKALPGNLTSQALGFFKAELFSVAEEAKKPIVTPEQVAALVKGNDTLTTTVHGITQDGSLTPTDLYLAVLGIQQENHPTQRFLSSNNEHCRDPELPEGPPAKNNEGPGPRKVKPSISERALEGKGFFDDGMPDGGCY